MGVLSQMYQTYVTYESGVGRPFRYVGSLGKASIYGSGPCVYLAAPLTLGSVGLSGGVDNIEELGRPVRYGHTLKTCDSFRNASDYRGLEIMCRITGLLQ